MCLAAIAGGLLGLAGPQTAGARVRVPAAHKLRFSLTRSKTEPYAACGRAKPRHAACMAIVLPSSLTHSLTSPAASAAPALAGRSLSGGGVGGGYEPADLRSAYNLPSATAGSGQTIAIVDAYDDPNAESDLATYRSHYGIAACTTANGCFKKVNETGGSKYPSGEPEWGFEISLDLDMASAACPNCHILLVEASSAADTNLYTAEDEAVKLGATEVSNSWGGSEESSDLTTDSDFHHPGVPITVAAGDFGYEVEYPAASPYVIAVGGTTLTRASNSRGWSETAWSETGSGCSEYEPKPAWQTEKGCTHRTNNDVAAVADPETPVSVADSYKVPLEYQVEPGWTLLGGTSVASPLVAGMMALSNAHTKSFPGAEALYRQADENGTGVLDDVVSGSNGSCGTYLCNAGPGYDGPTGLGSPYGAPLVGPAIPHWYKAGQRQAEGAQVAVLTWGGPVTLSQEGGANAVECKTVGAGYVENPRGVTDRTGAIGPPGVGETLTSAYYECKAPTCESAIKTAYGSQGFKGVGFAVAENLPWSERLIGTNAQTGGAAAPFEEEIGAEANATKSGKPLPYWGKGAAEGPAGTAGGPEPQAPNGAGLGWGAPGALGAIVGCEISPNPEHHAILELAPGDFGTAVGEPKRVANQTPLEGRLHPEVGGSLDNAGEPATPAEARFNGQQSGELEDPLTGPASKEGATGSVKYVGYERQAAVDVEGE